VAPNPPAVETNRANAPETQEKDSENKDTFYKRKFICPLCLKPFKTLKPRQKYIVVEKADDDFCLYYKSVNPLYYEINVCPNCGYSFNSSTYSPVKDELKQAINKILSEIWEGNNYCGLRTLEEAIRTFKLAIDCQRQMGADDATMGRFFLKLGWLHRYLKDKEQEHRNLEKALYHLSRSFETSTSEDPKEEINLMFLLGQLHLILGDEKGSINWFVNIVQHPERKSYPYIVNRARNAWQEIRRKPDKKV